MHAQFQFRRSRFLDALLTLAHGVALAALYPLDLPFWPKMALALVILASLVYQQWRAASSFAQVLVLEGDQAVLTCEGKQVAGRLVGDSFVTPYLAVLNILPEGARFTRSVVILPDSLDAESFRQLRVLLKWGVRAD